MRPVKIFGTLKKSNKFNRFLLPIYFCSVFRFTAICNILKVAIWETLFLRNFTGTEKYDKF